MIGWQVGNAVETALGYDSKELGFGLLLTSSWFSTLPFRHLSQCQKMFMEASVCCVLCRVLVDKTK